MMRTSIAMFFPVVLLAMLAASPASAEWGASWSRCRTDWHRNNCWPEPFSSVDRMAVRGPFAAMAANGWQRELTLAAYHFDTETHQLNSAGQSRLAWILTQAPEHRRSVFVLNHRDPSITATRMSNVQHQVSELVRNDTMPDVLVTTTAPRGISAGYVDSVHRQRQENQPAPILPAMELIGGQ